VDFSRHFYNKRWMQVIKPYVKVNDFCELGCGGSTLLVDISKHAKNLWGIDYSDEDLRASRKFFKK